MNAIVQYLQNATEELKKVTWPTRNETTNTTILVISVSLSIAALLGAIDFGLNKLLEILLQAF